MLPGDAAPVAGVDTAALERCWALPRPPAGLLLLLQLLLLPLLLPSRKAAASQAAASGFLAIRSVPAVVAEAEAGEGLPRGWQAGWQ